MELLWGKGKYVRTSEAMEGSKERLKKLYKAVSINTLYKNRFRTYYSLITKSYKACQ